jgi:hypothetical protein
MVAPVGRRRLADDVAKRPAEGAQAREADVEADVGHAGGRRPQQEHRPLHAPALQVPVRRLAERRAEGADEVGLGDVGDARQRRDVQRLGVPAVHRVTGPEHPAVGLLDGAVHHGSSCHVPLPAERGRHVPSTYRFPARNALEMAL